MPPIAPPSNPSASPATSPWRSEISATLRLAGPLALANLLQMAVYAIDVVFVARLGQEALAAASLAVALFSIINWGLLGLTGAVAPMVAAELGKRAHTVRDVRRTLRMGLWLAAACALVGMAICHFGGALMLATGQDPLIAARAQGFLSVLSLALVPMIAGNVLRSFVSAMGRPGFATAITALAIVVNSLGNYIFVFGHCGAPALGLIGSALSSVITGTITLAAYVLAIQTNRRMRRARLFGRWWRPEWQRLQTMVRMGVPIALTVVAEGALFGSAAFLMGRIAPVQLAAHTIALQIAAAFFQIPYGIGQAATIRVGFHYGAGDRAGAGRAGWTALATALATQCFAAAAMLLVPHLILAAYINVAAPENALLISYAKRFLIVAAAFQLFDGVQTVAAGALRGLQDTRMPMVIALAGYWLAGFTTAAWLGLGTPLQGLGVWIGLMTGLVVVAALLLWRWHRRDRLGIFVSAGPSHPV